MRTVVGLYDVREDARGTIEALVDAGFPRDTISMATLHDTQGDKGTPREPSGETRDAVGPGAAGGTVLGGLGSLLIGLGTVALPRLGVMAAAGPLAGLLTGGVSGGATGGLAGALVSLGIPAEESEAYVEGIRRKGTLVLIQAEELRANEARDIMSYYNPVDLEQRTARWQEEGWTGHAPETESLDQQEAWHQGGQEREHRAGQEPAQDEAPPSWWEETPPSRRAEAPRSGRENVQPTRREADRQPGQTRERTTDTRDIVEEEVHVGKRSVKGGGVRVHTHNVSRPVEEQVLLHHEHIGVEHIDLDQGLEHRDFAFDVGEGSEEVIELYEIEEQVIVEKRAHVVGQVRIIKDVETETEIVRETARRREVDVERLEGRDDVDVLREAEREPARADSEPSFDELEMEFRRHYQQNLAEQGRDFSFYRPAYIYGCRLARRQTGREQDWSDVEREARRRWLEANPDTSWMEVNDAVYESYNRCQSSA